MNQVILNGNKKQMLVKHTTSGAVIRALKTMFPHMDVSNTADRPGEGHLLARMSRSLFEGAALKLLPKDVTLGRLQDVGFSRRLFNVRGYHGCENGRDPYTLAKFEVLKRANVVQLTRLVSNYDQARDTYTHTIAVKQGTLAAKNNPMQPTLCHHDALHCNCYPRFRGAILTHSIYYFTPQDMVALVRKYTAVVAIYHEFKTRSGDLFTYVDDFGKEHREGAWITRGFNNIECQMLGNAEKYRHPNPTWLYTKGQMVRVGNQTLVWEFHDIDTTLQTRLARFQVVNSLDKPKLSKINIVPEGDLKPRKFVIVEGVKYPQWVIDELEFQVPIQKMDAEALQFSAGRIVRYAQTLKKEYPELAVMIARNAYPLTTSLIKARSVAFEKCRKSIGRSPLLWFRRINNLIEGKWYRSWKWLWILLAIMIVFAGVTIFTGGAGFAGFAIFGGKSDNRTGPAGLNSFGSRQLNFFEDANDGVGFSIAVITATLLVVITSIFLLIYIGWRLIRRCKYKDWDFNGSKRFLEGIKMHRCILASKLYTPLPNMSYKAMDSIMEVDPSTVRTDVQVVNFDPINVSKQLGVRLVGPAYTAVVPLVHSNSPVNVDISIKTRILKKQEPADEIYSSWLTEALYRFPFYYKDRKWHYTGDDFLTGCQIGFYKADNIKKYMERAKVNPMRYKRLQKAYDRHKLIGFEPKELAFKAFIKRDKEMLITQAGTAESKPRMIQGVSEQGKIYYGPWFYDFNKLLKMWWNRENNIWYCSGATTDDFHSWFTRVLAGHDEFLFLSSDFSSYDMTQGKDRIKAEWRFFEYIGLHEVINPFTDNKHPKEDVHAFIKSNVYYKAIIRDRASWQGNVMRKSGNSNTSSSNSYTTALSMSMPLDDMGIKYNMAVLGDDNIIVLKRKDILDKFEGKIAFTDYMRNYLKKFGFVAKLILTNTVEEAEFLSLKVYNTLTGYYVGKKPGRVLCRLGWLLDKIEYIQNPLEKARVFKGVLISYLPTSNHVPFLRVYVHTLLRHMAKIEAKHSEISEYLLKGELKEADIATWVGFSDAYGLTRTDEENFAAELEQGLKFGNEVLIDSKFVKHLVQMEDIEL